jgi:uncharacterized protein (DUF1778 family)
VRVTQDLQLLSGLSPLARAGDRFDAGFTLRNTTARAMTVKATLAGQADGAALAAQPAPQTVQLAAGAATEVRWSVQVPEGATRIDWEASAQESGAEGKAAKPASDRVKIAQAVAPAVPLRVWQASLLPLEGTLSMPVAPPADALPQSARVQVALQPRLSGALPGLRRYFETYPYSCLEQKTSRSIALRDTAGWARLRDEAAGYLDPDGLAHYFPPSPGSGSTGSDRLTAYLLSAAHEAGVAWPDTTRDARLEARVSAAQKSLLQQAAALSGRTLSEFLVASAQDAARRVIAEHESILLSREEQLAFVKALLNPPEPNARLKRAAKAYRQRTGM